jgi:hypothetical protein
MAMQAQLAGGGVKRIDDQLVDAQIGGAYAFGSRCWSAHAAPSGGRGSAATMMLDEVGHLAQRAVIKDG